MKDEYAAVCGITKEELFSQMQPEIKALADNNNMTYEEACAALTKKTEETSAAGRSDMVVETESAVYVFEYKLDGTVEEALAQIDSLLFFIFKTRGLL